MLIRIQAKGSEGNSYNVDFIREDGKLSVFCDCAAGEWGKYCKHKWELLSGNEDFLFNKSEIEQFKTVREWVAESNFENLYSELNRLQKEQEEIRIKIKKEKKNIEQKFKNGF